MGSFACFVVVEFGFVGVRAQNMPFVFCSTVVEFGLVGVSTKTNRLSESGNHEDEDGAACVCVCAFRFVQNNG